MPDSFAWRRLLSDRALYLLLAAAALAVTLAYQRSDAYVVALGTTRDENYLEGFQNPERSSAGPFRWTSARADLRLPDLWPAQPVRLTLTLSAPHPGGVPVPVTLGANSRTLDTVALGPAPRMLAYDLDAGALGASGSLYLTIQAPTFTAPGDTRALGAAVSRIEVTPLASAPFAPSLPVLATVTALAALAFLWLRRLGARRAIASISSLVCIAFAAAGLWFARPLFALYDAQALFTVGVAMAVSECASWLAQRATKAPRDLVAARWTAILCLAAFAIRMVLAHAPGDPANFIAFKMMIAQVAQHGLASIYDLDPVVGAYPPVHHYDWALISFIYRTFVSPDFELDSLRLNFIMKLPTITLDMLITLILMAYAARWRGARFALLAGAAYALNPGILYDTAYNGQLGDPLYALFVTLAVVALVSARPLSFGSAAALALLTKPQAAAFLPFFVVGGFCCLPGPPISRARLKALVAAGLTALLVLLPFLLAGTLGDMLRTVATTIGHGPRLSSNAYNLWWLAAWGDAWNVLDTGAFIGPLSYRLAGLLLLGVANGLMAWKLRSNCGARALTLLAAFAGLAFFLLPTEIHENYLFPTLPLLVLCAVHERRVWPLWAILSATWFVNVVLVDSELPYRLSEAWPAFDAAIFPIQVLAALLNLGVLLVWLGWVVRLRHPPGMPATTS